MSYGVMMCGNCQREIHQDGPEHSWRHCVDKTPICQNAEKLYAGEGEGVGVFCHMDSEYRVRTFTSLLTGAKQTMRYAK